MSNFKSKLARRIMAFILSGAMVMSNMSAYAAELAPKETIETEETVEVKESDETVADSDADTTDSDADTTDSDADTTDNTDTVDDDADTTDSGKNDTPQSEQTNTSEDIKASLTGLTNLKIDKNETSDKWELTWDSVSIESDDSNEYGTVTYKIEVTKDNASIEDLGGTTVTEADEKVKYEFQFGENHEEGTYTFTVTATAAKTEESEDGNLTLSESATYVYTKETTPDEVEAPENVTAALNAGKDGVVVSWNIVTDADSYEVTAKGQDGAEDVAFSGQIDTSGQEATATFSIGSAALVRGKSYKFSVVAVKGEKKSVEAETADALVIPNDSVNPPSGDKTKTYVLTGADLGATAASDDNSSRTDRAGTEGYFKINYNNKSQIDSNGDKREWSADYSGSATKTAGKGEDYTLPKSDSDNPTYRIRMNTYSSNGRPTIGFTTEAASVEVRVWWAAGGTSYRYIKLLDGDGKDISGLDYPATTENGLLQYNSWTLSNDSTENTYYIANQTGDNYLYKVEVIETSDEEIERSAWTRGTNPKISMTKKSGEDGTESTDTMTVEVSDFSLSDAGADKLVVEILKDDEVVDTKVVRTEDAADSNSHASYSFDYQTTESGSYTAKATLTRTVTGEYDETNKTATNEDDTANAKTATSDTITISLGLTTPENFKAQQVANKYEVKLDWDIVNGGDGYQITVSEKDSADVLATYTIDDKNTLTYTATGYGTNNETSFAAGKTYTFTIKSTSGDTLSTEDATVDVTIEEVIEDSGSKVVYTLDVKDMETKTYDTADTDVSAGTGDYFTLLALAAKKTAIQDVNDTTNYETGHPVWSDGYEGTKRINFQGKAQSKRNVIKFTTEGAATVKVWWVNAGDSSANSNRQVEIFKSTTFNSDYMVAASDETYAKNDPNYSELSLTEAGTYYLGCSLNTIHIYKIVVEETVAVTENDYTLDVKDMETKTYDTVDTDVSAGTDDYFTLLALAAKKTAIQDVNDTTIYETGHPVWSDGYEGTKRINFQGKAQSKRNVIKFTTEGAATVKVWWVNAGDSSANSNRQVEIFKSTTFNSDNMVAASDETYAKNDPNYSELALTEAGTYYLGCSLNTIHIYKIVVTETKEGIDRGNWDKVEKPEIVSATSENGVITVTAKGVVNTAGEGADYITIEMYNAAHLDPDLGIDNPRPLASEKVKKNTTGDHLTIVTFSPENSGTYAFKAILSRKDTEVDEDGNETVLKDYGDKESDYYNNVAFNLPLATPAISDLQNKAAGSDGLGVVSVVWESIAEADYYELSVTDESGNTIEVKDGANIEGTSYLLDGLEIDKTIAVKLKAWRENAVTGAKDASEWSAERVIKVTGEEPKSYVFDALDYVDVAGTTAILQAPGSKFGTSNYFTLLTQTVQDPADTEPLVGSGGLRKNSSGSSVWLELSKSSSAWLEFTVYGTASASFSVASTGSGNVSIFGLVGPDGKLVSGTITGADSSSVESEIYLEDTETKGTAYLAKESSVISTIKYDNLPAGTYKFIVPFKKGSDGKNVYGRAGRVHKAIVYDSGDMPEKDAWGEDTTGTPIISEIAYIKGETDITVTASGYVGYNGADSLRVDMLDKDGNVIKSDTKAAESTVNEDKTEIKNEDQTFTFTPEASGDYSFRASLVRSGEDDIEMKDNAADWTVTDFVLPLAQAGVSAMTNVSDADSTDEKKLGGLEVIFPSVDEADYYVVTAFSKEGKELVAQTYTDIEAYENPEGKEYKLASGKDEENALTVTIYGIPTGATYVITQAFRKTDSGLNMTAGKKTLTRTVNPETGEVTVEEKNAPVSEWIDQWKVDKTALEIEAVSATEDGNATALVRSLTSKDSQKYINGKDDTRWFYSAFGSNTSSTVTYSRPKGLNEFDNEYKSGDDEYNSSTGAATVVVNGYKEEVYEEGDSIPEGKGAGDLKSVTVWSENGRGKVVPASIDGLSYYYTEIDPSVNNFTLSALIHVKSWQYSNGQDGFGMMVSDTVGKNGDDGNTWTNAYQLLASKIQYSWVRATEDTPGYVTDAGGNGTTIMRYEMKLGVGWNSKEGATAADVAKINAGTATAPANFVTDSGTLETSAGNRDGGKGIFTGSYNVVGNGYNTTAIPTSSVATAEELLTDFRFQIQKYDNAYVLRYLKLDAAPELTDEEKASGKYAEMNGTWYEILGEQVFSDENNNKLTQVDKNKINVGFFAARYARIGVSQIDLELTEADKGDRYEIPTTYVDPSVTISSEENSNNRNYDLLISANFDGTLTIYKEDEDGKTTVTSGKAITAGTKYTFTSALKEGTTKFTYYAKPNENYVPGDNQALKNFDMQTNEKLPLEVTYHAFTGNEIYVAPNGALIGTTYTVQKDDGTEELHYVGDSADHPTNVYDAVNYAAAGQTIILAGGMYNLTTDAYSDTDDNGKPRAANLLIGKNHDGTSKAYITMKAADDATARPVLNFGQNTQKNDTAFTIAGNYWRFEGFDVMGSLDGQKGILLGGSHNVLNDLRTYLNGNTGVQVARYSNNTRSEWPSYNTIINCSSFMNYDAGYEDADGFAAKLTCGDGNRFIGCIAAYNADDGWDLFAKIETGSIGVVSIENCLAFKNGYLFGVEDYYGSGSDLIYRYTDFSKYTKNTPIVSAGNGNGFKMGGDSMSGYHVLKNSIAFGNKSKGIDSNSCPDIQIYNSISFNNELSNVALYTGSAVNTDYYVQNMISFKDSSCSGYATDETFDLRGTQNRNKVYNTDNYYWTGTKSKNGDYGKAEGDAFDTSVFKHKSMNTAIFGSASTPAISRDPDGSINLHGFLEKVDSEGNLESNIGSSDPNVELDLGADIYVFAEQYKGKVTLSSIKLADHDGTKALSEAGYDWKDGEIELATFAGTAVDFTVINKTTKMEKTVTVNFIQLDGAELRVVSGDDNNDDVLDAYEEWIVEAVPVISPAVEPNVALDGFKAEIKETSKGLLELGTPAVGTVNKNLNVTGANLTVKGKGVNGNAQMSAVISLTAGGKTVKQTAVFAFSVKDSIGIKFDTIDPEPNPTSDQVRWTANSDYIQVAMNTMTGKDFTMKNLHFAETDINGNETVKDFGKGVTIKVNDTKVIKLKTTTSSTNGVDATFTVVNKNGDGGTATVTVTSKNDKSLVRNYIVTVSGSEFAWNASTITIDKAKTDGVQLTAVAPFDQSIENIKHEQTVENEDGSGDKTSETIPMDGITVKAVYKGTKVSNSPISGVDSCFEAKRVTSSVYELNTTKAAISSLSNGTYTIVYQAEVPKKVTTENGDGTTSTVEDGTEMIAFTPITIKVIETKPTVTFKQKKKVNLFYKNGTDGSTGILTASSKQGAVTVTASSSEYFRFDNNGEGYDIVSIKKNPVSFNEKGTAVDYKDVKQNNKVTLKAHVDGYYDEYDVEKSFTIGLEYRQPKLKLKALDKTIYTAIGMKSADVWIYDPDSEMYLTPDTANITLVTDQTVNKKAYSKANADFIIDGSSSVSGSNGETGVKLTVASDAVKGGTVKLSIQYDDWFNDPVIVSQSIKVTDKVPKVTIKPVKLNINTAKFVGKEQASAAIVLTGATGFEISDVTLEGANDKAASFLKFVDYELSTDINGNAVLLVNLKAKAADGSDFPASADSKGVYKMNSGYASSYGFKVKYKLGSVEQETNLNLSLVSKEKLTVSVKGTINMIDRENSAVLLKPKMTNFTPSQVASVALAGDAARLFTIAEFDRSTGVMTIQAKETADLKQGSYKVYPVYSFDLGVSGTAEMTTEKPIVISAKQSALKISGLKEPLEVKLSSTGTAAQRTITIAPAGAYITDMTQTSGLDNFTLTYTGDGVQVAIRNRAGLKEGATYKITAYITVEGGGSNVKKQIITIPVRVIR